MVGLNKKLQSELRQASNTVIAVCVLIVFALPAVVFAQTTTVLTAVDDPTSGRYCASTNGDVTQVDSLNNDINAAVVATTTAPGKVTSIRTQGDYAFMGGYRFNVYDISSSTDPQQIASLRYASGTDSDQQIRDIRIESHRDQAYTIDSTAPKGNDYGSTIWSIDISDKSNPSVDDYISFDSGYYEEIWGGESLALKDNHLFGVDVNPGDLRSVYTKSTSNLGLSTSSALSEVPIGHDCRLANNTCENDFGYDGVFEAKEVRISGDYAYTVHNKSDGEFRVFYISDPFDMLEVASVDTNFSNPETLETHGDYLFVGGDSGVLHAYDISNRAQPQQIDEINLMDSDSDITSLFAHENRLYVTLSNIDTGDKPDPNDLGGVMALDISDRSNLETLWGIELGNSPERVVRHNDLLYVADSGEGSTSTESLMYVIDPDNGYKEINDYNQPDSGTVTVDDQGTSDKTDDEFSYSPSATGTDSFTYNIAGDPTQEANVSATATVAFDVQESQCDVADISVGASPQETTLHKGSSTLSWSYDDVSDCETQDGTSQWRNIDPMANANCPEGVEDGSCSGSDSADITDLDSAKTYTFTLACDTANDGDQTIDVSTSTDVTVTDLTACPFTEGSGDDEYQRVVSINEELNANGPASTETYSVDLSAGEYELAFFNYDDARGSNYDRSSQDQDMERAFAEFASSGTTYDEISSSTDDIPDDSQLGTSTTKMSITFSESVEELTGKHHAHKVSGPYSDNSFVARCIAIDEKDNQATTTISASTTSIPYNGSTTLDWSYDHVDTGTTSSDTGNSQWAGTDAIQTGCSSDCNGSHSKTIDNLTQDTDFTVTFDGTYGSTVSDTVSVNVAEKPVDLNVDLDAVQLKDDVELSWNDTNMSDCEASSDPTNSQWASTTDPSPSGGTTTVTDLATTTDFTLTCTEDGTTISDTVTVEVIGFNSLISAENIWGVPYENSLTTQSKITFNTTDSFDDDIELTASMASDTGYDVSLWFLDADGNNLQSNPTIDSETQEEGVWLQAEVGSGVVTGRQEIDITAEAVNGTTTDTHTINMFIRGIGEF